MKKTEKRQTIILNALENQGRLRISEVMSMLDVSESTARRLLVSMEEKNLAIRTFGGIQKILPTQSTYSYKELEQKMSEEKIRIGQLASTLVSDHDIIFISGGTTVFQMAVSLAQRLKTNEINDITVVTSSFVNVEVLGSYCKVILTGGEYRPERRDFAGFMTEQLIQSLSVDQCFLGVDGINANDGLMSYDAETARIDQIVISRSNNKTTLCDSSKFSKRGFISLAPINDINNIITDTDISPDKQIELKSLGITVYCA